MRGGRKVSMRTRYLLWLVALAIFDIIVPIPLTASILIYVVLRRPAWFWEMVSEAYGRTP